MKVFMLPAENVTSWKIFRILAFHSLDQNSSVKKCLKICDFSRLLFRYVLTLELFRIEMSEEQFKIKGFC